MFAAAVPPFWSTACSASVTPAAVFADITCLLTPLSLRSAGGVQTVCPVRWSMIAVTCTGSCETPPLAKAP